jgi:hypothetical protein
MKRYFSGDLNFAAIGLGVEYVKKAACFQAVMEQV